MYSNDNNESVNGIVITCSVYEPNIEVLNADGTISTLDFEKRKKIIELIKNDENPDFIFT